VVGNLKVAAEPGKPTIVMMRTFDAPRSVVFKAWTTPEHVARWWDPSGVPLAVCEIDLRPGGAFRWVNGSPGGLEHPFAGTYRDIAAPERLVFSARNRPAGPESLATLTFIEDAGQTTLTMTIECHSVADRDAMLEMRVDAGTARTLDNLAEYLRTIS